MAEYRAGHLATVQRLDGFPAFDAELLAALVPIDKWAGMASDESDSVRQLVATTLSKTADAKYTQTLIKLVTDKQVEVAREAAVGLGKIGNDAATQPLVDALSKADKPSREKFLQALRDGIGTAGLVLALKTVQHTTPESEKFQTKQIFDMIHELEDPRGGDSLYAYIQSNPKPHWKNEAAMRLAEIGDVRAAEYLGWRMQQDPLKLYNDVDWPELRRDDNERVYGARMLADLAVAHPEKRDYLLKNAEPGVLYWVDPDNKPQPHANGMRFLAAIGSTKALPMLEGWADPKTKLPNEGAQPPFPEDWATAQSALRYLGWTKDPSRGWQILEKQLHRRNKKLDVSWDSLMQGGLTIVGMTLRALGVGAADGFAQWGDPKAYDDLVKYAEDPMENEQARMEACFALAWVATDDQMKDVVKKIHDNTKTDPKSNFQRQCYLETVIRKPVPDATAGLIDLLSATVPDMEVRHQVARAIGMGGITHNMVQPIFDKLSDTSMKADAALALILGADADTAARAIATYNDPSQPAEAIEELKDVYNKTFGYWSDRNYDNGDIARWVENAQAISHVKVHDALQDWPRADPRAQPGRVDRDRQRAALDDARAAAHAPDGRREGQQRRQAHQRDLDPEVHQGEGRAHGPSQRARAARRPGQAGVLRGHEPEDDGRVGARFAQVAEGQRGLRAGGLRRLERHSRPALTSRTLPSSGGARLAAMALGLGLGHAIAACAPPAAAPGNQTPVQATNLVASPGVTLVAACTPAGPELCFNAVDDNCNGIIDEGCGEPTGVLQFTIAWGPATPDVNLVVVIPSGERVPSERSHATAGGFHLDHDCPADDGCNGQNEEDVYFDGVSGGEPPKGHYTVEISLVDLHGGDAPVKVRFGARLGARVVGFDVELSPGQDAKKTFSFDVP